MASKKRLSLLGMKDNQLICSGQWWRLLTPVAVHANLLHLLCNTYALNDLGPLVESLSGRQRFVSVYTVSGLVGSLASFAFTPLPSIGASGAIFGLGGALAVHAQRHRQFMGARSDAIMETLGESFMINFIIGCIIPSIDQWCHMGGLAGGAMTAFLLGPSIEEVKGKRGKKHLRDNPPLPIFAGKL